MPGMGARLDFPSNDPPASNQHPHLSLVEVICGYPLTVDANKNPFQSRPEDLNERMWYLVRLDQIGDSDACSWKPKGEPRQMPFPDLPIVCWEISRAFHEGNNRETNWMMLQYNITTTNGMFSVCRIGKHPMNRDARVGVQVPVDSHLHLVDVYPVPIANGNLFDSNFFLRGDFLELQDLDIPLFPL